MFSPCELREQKIAPALTIRTRTPVEELPQVLGNGYGAIAGHLEQMQQWPAGPPFAVYYNTDMQDLDVEFGFPVADDVEGRDDIHAGKTPGGKIATCLHTGPYSEVGPGYEALFKWIAENGYETTGVAFEVYLNDPDQTPPDELQTQIALVLRAT